MSTLIRRLWRDTSMAVDDHSYESRQEQANFIEADVNTYSSDYRSDITEHARKEQIAKKRYDSAWADANDAHATRYAERKKIESQMVDEARDTFKTGRTLLCGKKHGIILYDSKPGDGRRRWLEGVKHRRQMGKYNKKFMQERLRTEVRSHGVFTYDKKEGDMSKFYIEQVYVNGNGIPYDYLVRFGNTQRLHGSRDDIRKWESEGYVCMNPEKL